LFIKFFFYGNETRDLVLPWEDLAVVRKDYCDSDIAGEENTPILDMLELINTTNQGIANAVKATANLRGILKSTKAMLSTEDIRKQKEEFVKDYLNLENEGGIASLDATQEFAPITMSPTITNYAQMKEFRENVYRYFGISDAIVMSDYTESQMEAFYEARIEPFLVALSLELTRKIFTKREQGFDNHVVYESNRMQYASNKTKLDMVALVDRGALTPNEWRQIFNLAPVEGGDVPIRRLDTAAVDGGKGKDEATEDDSKQEGESKNE
jgi:HK97 family phage portal protein